MNIFLACSANGCSNMCTECTTAHPVCYCWPCFVLCSRMCTPASSLLCWHVLCLVGYLLFAILCLGLVLCYIYTESGEVSVFSMLQYNLEYRVFSPVVWREQTWFPYKSALSASLYTGYVLKRENSWLAITNIVLVVLSFTLLPWQGYSTLLQ